MLLSLISTKNITLYRNFTAPNVYCSIRNGFRPVVNPMTMNWKQLLTLLICSHKSNYIFFCLRKTHICRGTKEDVLIDLKH